MLKRVAGVALLTGLFLTGALSAGAQTLQLPGLDPLPSPTEPMPKAEPVKAQPIAPLVIPDEPTGTPASPVALPMPVGLPKLTPTPAAEPMPMPMPMPTVRPMPTPAVQPTPTAQPMEPVVREQVQIGGPGQEPNNPTGRQEPAVSIEWIGPATAKVNQPADYAIMVRNVCNIAVQKVIVQVRVPQGVAVNATEPKAEAADNVLMWECGTLLPKQEKRLTLSLVSAAKSDLS